jgi:hypothetical protein
MRRSGELAGLIHRNKWLVVGRGTGRRVIEAVYLLDDDSRAALVAQGIKAVIGSAA